MTRAREDRGGGCQSPPAASAHPERAASGASSAERSSRTKNKCHARQTRSVQTYLTDGYPVETGAEVTGARPAGWQPRYVHACHAQAWSMELRRPGPDGAAVRVAYRCGSRRHHGPCRAYWTGQLYSRLSSPECIIHSPHALFVTMTLPAPRHRRRSDRSRLEDHAELGERWRRFIRALGARLRRAGHPRPRYVWVREDHQSGVPHVHAVIVHPELHARASQYRPDADGYQAPPPDVAELLSLAGWGERCDWAPVRSPDAVSSYLAKVLAIADDREGATAPLPGEMAKSRQAPELLPPHCRSYGASPGALPPRPRSDWHGWMRTDDGAVAGRRAPRGSTLTLDPATGREVMRDGVIAWSDAGRRAEPSTHAWDLDALDPVPVDIARIAEYQGLRPATRRYRLLPHTGELREPGEQPLALGALAEPLAGEAEPPFVGRALALEVGQHGVPVAELHEAPERAQVGRDGARDVGRRPCGPANPVRDKVRVTLNETDDGLDGPGP